MRFTILDVEVELGVVGVPEDVGEANVAGVSRVTGVDGAGVGGNGVGAALNTSFV